MFPPTTFFTYLTLNIKVVFAILKICLMKKSRKIKFSSNIFKFDENWSNFIFQSFSLKSLNEKKEEANSNSIVHGKQTFNIGLFQSWNVWIVEFKICCWRNFTQNKVTSNCIPHLIILFHDVLSINALNIKSFSSFYCVFPSINIFHIACVFISTKMKIDNVEDKKEIVGVWGQRSEEGKGARNKIERWKKKKNQFFHV